MVMRGRSFCQTRGLGRRFEHPRPCSHRSWWRGTPHRLLPSALPSRHASGNSRAQHASPGPPAGMFGHRAQPVPARPGCAGDRPALGACLARGRARARARRRSSRQLWRCRRREPATRRQRPSARRGDLSAVRGTRAPARRSRQRTGPLLETPGSARDVVPGGRGLGRHRGAHRCPAARATRPYRVSPPRLSNQPPVWRPRGDRKRAGTGLGLSIARGFMEAMGGAITATNGAAGGAVFILTIPVAA